MYASELCASEGGGGDSTPCTDCCCAVDSDWLTPCNFCIKVVRDAIQNSLILIIGEYLHARARSALETRSVGVSVCVCLSVWLPGVLYNLSECERVQSAYARVVCDLSVNLVLVVVVVMVLWCCS